MSDLSVPKTGELVAWVFSGQNSQKLGMGLDLLGDPFARARFNQAQKILDWSVLEVCQNWHKLKCTVYTQPCLYVIQTLLIDLLKQKGEQHPDLVAGYSLGEYAAIYASEVFDFETGLYLIKRRAEIMHRAPKGSMVALIGFNWEQLEQQIEHTPNVWRVNDSPTTAIISGTPEAVEFLLTKITVKWIIRLNISAAFHTPIMTEAAAEFLPILESTPFNSAKVPFLSSTELIPIVEPTRLKSNLIQQMTQPVKWQAVSLSLAKAGIKKVVEIGPGKDLASQMKKICPELIFTNLSTIPEKYSLASPMG